MSVSRIQRRFVHFLRSLRLWFFGFLGLVALGSLYYFLATVGPRRVATSETVISQIDDPAMARLSAEVDELEKQYRQAAEANVMTPAMAETLVKAIDKQKELLRTFSKAGFDQSTRLVRLEAELDSVRAREKNALIERLEKDGEELLAAGKTDEAGEKLRDALRLQREVNLSAATSRHKNYVRETSLSQAVAAVDAAPLRREFEAALDAARKAAAEQRWSEALTAYTTARDMQARINREYGRTRYSDLAGADRLEAEIESLNAAGIASDIDEREKAGDEAAKQGLMREAAGFYAEAGTLQLQVNQNYTRSRFVSSQRIENLETKRQTALSSETAEALAALDREIAAHLARREVVAAEQKLDEAARLSDRLFTQFPKSTRLDGALRIKIAYLMLRRTDFRMLQDEVYDRLVPLPGATERLMLRTEVPQSLYVLVMNTNPSRNPGRSLPVDSVSWLDATEFCNRLSWLLGRTVRLPSGDEFRVAVGDELGASWDRQNSGGRTQEVGRKEANASGFSDLTGNVAEWTLADAGTDRAEVVGGSYLDEPETLRKFNTEQRAKSDRARHVGFRIVVEL